LDDDEARERFTALYDANRTHVWAYATCRVGRQHADEVVSDTFVVAWRRFAEIPEPALPWLVGVARNVARERLRAEARRESVAAELRSLASSPADPAADVSEAVTDRLEVLSALAELPENDREALILTAWQGLSPREAALVVGSTPTAMRVRLHRARKRLAAELGAASRQQATERRAPIHAKIREEAS